MHRSGTSLTANLLRQGGLWLGAENELHGATPDNPDGHWENIAVTQLNDALLNELGGGWDNVPEFPARWAEHFPAPSERAKEIHAHLERAAPWGWKDPRASLLLPFWLALVPDARVVICVRHPLEVALSLRRRGLMSYALGLKLWRAYNERLLADVPRSQRLVVHYEQFFTQPLVTLKRLANFCGLNISDAETNKIAATAKPELRHTRFTGEQLAKISVAPEIVNLYAQLCGEAGFADAPKMLAGNLTAAKQLDLDALAYELFVPQWNGFVQKNTPPGARIAVVSKGDDNLLKFTARAPEHFPRDAQGRYAGFHPADDAEALAQLEIARKNGAQFLALPHSARWWLEMYPQFAARLSALPVAAENKYLGIIFQLAGSASACGQPQKTV
ncbi:MAG: hypothetical protein RL616_2190 [Verrucomicrobiota bacterium]